MCLLLTVPPHANDNPASPSPELPWSDQCKLIISRCAFSISTILGLFMVIVPAIPARMLPKFGLNLGSSLSSLNIFTFRIIAQWNITLSVKNLNQLFAIQYTHMKLLLSFGQLALSHFSLIPIFTHGLANMTTVRAKALSTIAIVNDLGLNGREVTIDLVAKAEQRLHLGPRWVAVFSIYFSCMAVTFTAPTNSKGGGYWMILGGTLSCMLDLITQL